MRAARVLAAVLVSTLAFGCSPSPGKGPDEATGGGAGAGAAPAAGPAFGAGPGTATVRVRTPRERAQALSALNVERVDTLLLPAMRKAGIDCWIVMSRENNVDFVLTYLLDEPAPTGGHRNAYVFFDDGSDRLKRVVIGTYLFRTSRIYDQIIEYRTGPEPFGPSLAPELRKVIDGFRPKRIAINQSRTIPMCDGLTVEMRKYLEQAIGPTYASRLVSAEPLIVDVLETRLPAEAELFSEAAAITRMIYEEVLSDRVITPGKTTLLDLTWHMTDRLAALDIDTWFTPIAAVKRAEGTIYAGDTVVQPGDIVYVDFGILYAGLATDYQKTGYVLKPGETEPPAWLRQAFANALVVQDAVVALARPGSLGFQLREAAEARAARPGVTPSVYSHSVAIGGHGVGAFIAPDWPDRWGDRVRFPLRAGAYYSFESSATSSISEWGGRPLTIATEEDVLLTESGPRYVIPRQEGLYVIGPAAR